ncbi:uncharacterized protein LOC113321960 [Papaver somniferum]|uniref:uncharacterized protein LOC113321960 n=1 Tax=Papaver somniferum TaxID=3469 RepID=UPI000E700F61|nr:uncharacterized protein LOC113321960 [Papaver somniferum]
MVVCRLISCSKTQTLAPLKTIFLALSCLSLVYLVVSVLVTQAPIFDNIRLRKSDYAEISSETTINHVVFGITSASNSWENRKEYVRLWWKPEQMRGCEFLDTMPLQQNAANSNLPPVCVSEDTSRFRYSFRGGDRSAIRVARVLLETVNLNHSNVRWFFLGDDDTVFFTESLVKTLSKYDHKLWYYIGSISETYVQNDNDLSSFEMAYGGGGFAVSYSLAKVLAMVLDSCLDRYPHLYGSDARIYSCLAELGVALTHEVGFHQVDLRGNLFGLLASHPLAPLISLHHLDKADPIFPNKTRHQAVAHLLKAATLDPHRVVQQTICYDNMFSRTISISWGHAVQIFEGNLLVRDLLQVRNTFKLRRKENISNTDLYMFNTRQVDSDLCKRPTIFFLESLSTNPSTNDPVIKSIYKNNGVGSCLEKKDLTNKLQEIRVLAHKLDLHIKQLEARRRQCCDVLPSSSDDKVLNIVIRECGEEEIAYMHP